MRAEQLLSVAELVRAEFQTRAPIEALAKLVTALEHQVDDPSPESQATTAAARDELYNATKDSSLDRLAPIDAEILASMKLPVSFGAGLARAVRVALNGSQITPQTACKRLQVTLSRALATSNAIKGALEHMAYLEVLPDDLEVDEFEVMVSIPGAAINEELEAFGKETLQLNRIFGVFEELITGARQPFKLRAIASTDPTIYILASAGVATAILTTLERITALYEKILGVVKLQRELSGKVPAATLDPIKEYISSEITAGLDVIKSEMVTSNSGKINKERKNEIEIELKFALRAIARRLDEGYLFDVRAGAAPETSGEQENPDQALLAEQHQKARQIIAERRPALRHFEAASEPILGLTGPDDTPKTKAP